MEQALDARGPRPGVVIKEADLVGAVRVPSAPIDARVDEYLNRSATNANGSGFKHSGEHTVVSIEHT